MNKFDLEERLINFSVKILSISELILKTYAGIHLSQQLARSGTSPALNYAEAIIVKEKPLIKQLPLIDEALKESNELICIFVSSIKTARSNEGK